MMVVCVQDKHSRTDEKWAQMVPNRPLKGCVYHVRNVINDNAVKRDGYLLAELVNPIHTWGNGQTCEGAFPIDWFREVKTPDLSVFTVEVTNGKGRCVECASHS
jgi:hypothetical protein